MKPTIYALRSVARAARAAAFALLAAGLAAAPGCSDTGAGSSPQDPASPDEWRMLGGGLARTYFNPAESAITPESAPHLVRLWRFLTPAIVTAQPIVAKVDLPGAPGAHVLYVSSWDGNLYALRVEDGGLVWSFPFKAQPGASYPQASSAAVEDVDGRRVVFVGGGMTMYALDAATGEEIWEFDAGTGCTTCDSSVERNEVESSPAILDGIVLFGMDTNDSTGKGGFFGVDARRGTMRWYFDVTTGATCTPNPGDEIRRFDGYHSAAALGLPEDFFATRSGCDFDRTPNSCGNVWSSATVDARRKLLYTVSSNCDTDLDPTTPAPPPPLAPFDEALFALHVDTGVPAWSWQPRSVDTEDLDFGAVPNLFAIEVNGKTREVVGVGNKDGNYYVLDRDGTNATSGVIEPYWHTKVVPGGSIGGLIASAAVGDGRVMFSTAIGTDLAAPQKPAVWALDATSGALLWNDPEAPPSYSPASAVPGVLFTGSIGGSLTAYESSTGRRLVQLSAGGSLGSPATVVGGRVFVGAGTGERGGNPLRVAFQVTLNPSPITAFCVAGSDGCPSEGSCDDGNDCTVDRSVGGSCTSAPGPDGTSCRLGAFTGHCAAGNCFLDAPNCPVVNQCTRPVTSSGSCRYEAEPAGTACTVRGQPGTCQEGNCLRS